MAHPVACARQELDAVLNVFLEILKNLQIERTLLDVKIRFLLQGTPNAVVDAIPNNRLRWHRKHASIDDRIVAILLGVVQAVQSL